jgi:hypothetical protein
MAGARSRPPEPWPLQTSELSPTYATEIGFPSTLATAGITALVSTLVTLDEVIGNATDLSSRLIVVEVAASPEGGILANGRALSSFQV